MLLVVQRVLLTYDVADVKPICIFGGEPVLFQINNIGELELHLAFFKYFTGGVVNTYKTI